MGLRRKSRELALQFFFGHDFQGRSCDREEVSKEFSLFTKNFETGERSLPYAETIIMGLCEHWDEVDRLLADHAHNWRMERMATVDRNLLRIAAWEMLYNHEVPRQVAINEALEIAKRYSNPDAVGFINGILDSLHAGMKKS